MTAYEGNSILIYFWELFTQVMEGVDYGSELRGHCEITQSSSGKSSIFLSSSFSMAFLQLAWCSVSGSRLVTAF